MRGRLLFSLALGAFFLWLSLRNVDLAETGRVLRNADYLSFAAFLLMNIVLLWLRTVRWSYLLRPVTAIKPGRLISPMCIGLMGNIIFPARAGEFIRAYLVGSREAVTGSAAFATVVVERLFDGLAIMSFFALAPFLLEGGDDGLVNRLKWAGLLVFLFYVTVLVVLLFLSRHRELLAGYLERHAMARRWRFVAAVFDKVRKFTDGLTILQSAGDAARALAMSFVIWGLTGFLNYMMMLAVDIRLPLYAAFFLVVMQSFGVMVPSPGFVGSYQYVHIVALGIYGVARADALGLSVLIHSGYFIIFLAAGLFFVSREHLSWRVLEKASEEGVGDGPPGKA